MAAKMSPKESITEEARSRAARLFAVLYPDFEESDSVRAGMLLDHHDTVINCMARAYQTILNAEAIKLRDAKTEEWRAKC